MDVDTKPARVVPSGQIYRQMFNAQLQLSRSLSQFDAKSRLQRLKSRHVSHGNTFPIIRLDKEDTQHGILNSRQKSWVGGFPNDPYTENPVLFKHNKEHIAKTLKGTESGAGRQEVQGLPDVVVSKKQGSDIISCIAASRKQRFEYSVEDMHEDLNAISTKMESRIEELSTKLIESLAENDTVLTNVFSRIESDEDLLQCQLCDLFALWDDVQGHTLKRHRWISDMDEGLKQIEVERMQKIKQLYAFYGEILLETFHLMPSDLQRFLDKETQMINQTVLSNRRSYADLYVRLISADIEREKSQRTKWRRRVDDWKALHTKLAIESFSKFMMTEAVISPCGVKSVNEALFVKQKAINAQRLDLVKSLCHMKPPNSTESSVYKWRQDMKKLTDELDTATYHHTNKMRQEYDRVCQLCLEQVEIVKHTLVDTGICSTHRANSVVDEFLLPLVGEQQRKFETKLEDMERVTEINNRMVEETLTRLMKFAQGVAHMWDTHEIGLAKQERALVEKLEQCRQQHDQNNQEKEASLDVVMDRMRQDATEIALKDSLIKALTMMESIRRSYEECHEQQMDIVQSYPDMVQEEIDVYDNNVCTFFSVSRKPMEQASEDTKSTASSPSSVAADVSKADLLLMERVALWLKSAQVKIKSEDSKSSKLHILGQTLSDLQGTVDAHENSKQDKEHYARAVAKKGQETITTHRGNVFSVSGKENQDSGYKTGDIGEQMDGQMEEVVDESEMPDCIQSRNIPSSLIADVKKTIRFNFLDHLDLWCEQAIDRAANAVAAKTEELNNELDLRLHLHKPRPRRAELDIHNVRAAELVMHAERVTRHCNGMEGSLAELGQSFKAMGQEHNKLANKFRMDIEALEVVFANATNSARLVKLQNQVSVELDKFMSIIRTSLRQFREHLDETLQTLKESNARFTKSLKVFAVGGNFCPEEIEDYQKKLEKMSAIIDKTESSIMSDLEGMESKRLDNATKITVEFEDRFKSHVSDLTFTERVARMLTNTQVKIKSEVANSNTQAQRLEQLLNDLERRVDACKTPSLDKEQITATQLNDTLSAIFQAFSSRSEYLNCAKPPSYEFAGAQAPSSAKVGFSAEGTTVGKDGRPETDDPSVNVIKSILKTQRSKMRIGVDSELDKELATSQPSGKGNEGSKGTRKTGSIAGDTGPKKIQSGSRRTGKVNQSNKKDEAFGGKIGEEDVDQKRENFLSIIQRIVKEALDALLATAEVFYREKGARTVTRPQALQETFQQYADVIAQKMQSYYHQSEQYHNHCLQEYRAQLSRLEHLTAHVPALVIGDLLKQEVQRSKDAQSSLIQDFQSTLDQLATRQKCNQKELRPTLGQPDQSDALAQVCTKEKERHQDYSDAIAKHTVNRQECVLVQSKEFLEKLVRMAETQLLQYDNMLVIDDMERGGVETTRYPTTIELIRRQKDGEPPEVEDKEDKDKEDKDKEDKDKEDKDKEDKDKEDKDASPQSAKANWSGVPSNEFVLEGKPSDFGVTPTVSTCKTTLAHSATIKARDKAYEDYKEQFERTLQQVAAEKERLMLLEKRWVDSWDTSVEKVKFLYQK